MSVIKQTEFNDANDRTREMYRQVERKFGAVPNFIKAMGDNPFFL